MTDSVGQQLRQAREARSLSLEEAATATHIRAHYLQALEAGEMEKLPSSAQGRGFLRAYAGFLGLKPQALLDSLQVDQEPKPAPPASPPTRPSEEEKLNTEQANAIFADIGLSLRRQREILGLSLDDVERHTHLRIHYLKALEAGDIYGLPSPVQGRGMLKNYADFLGMQADLLLRFAEGLQALLAAKQAARSEEQANGVRRPRTRPAPARRMFSLDIITGFVVVASLLGFVIWGAFRILDMRSGSGDQRPGATAPSISDVLSITSTPTLSPTLEISPEASQAVLPPPQETLPVTSTLETTPQETASLAASEQLTGTAALQGTPLPVDSSPLQLSLVIRERAWIRVTVDGKVELEGRVVPGSAYQFSGEQRIELLTGNGAALDVVYNQSDLGPLGAFGEVVMRVFTIEGIATPTATLTPTKTPGPAKTPTPTATPGAQPTGKPTGAP